MRQAYRPPTAYRRLLWRLRDLAFLTGDRLILRRARERKAVLVIAAHGMGDLVLFAGAYAALARHYAGFQITLVCTEAALDFARRYCPADEIIAIDRTRMRREVFYRWPMLRRIASGGYGTAIQTSYNRDLLVEDALVRASGAPMRIGSSGTSTFIDARSRRLGDRWYTRLLPASDRKMHELQRNAELLRLLEIEPAPRSQPLLAPVPRLPIVPAGRYVLVAVGSSHPMKSWRLNGFEKVAHAVAARENVQIVFSAGAGDGISPADFEHWDDTVFVDRLGTVDLDELLSLIGHAALVVSSDSAPVHLAAVLGTPSLAVVGGGMVDRYHPYPKDVPGIEAPDHVALPERWACFDCGWRCIYSVEKGEAAPCVAQITEERVRDAALARLAQLRVRQRVPHRT